MADDTMGWQPHPGGLVAETYHAQVPPGRVVALGAVCDLHKGHQTERTTSFLVSEFATLDDGRRITLHSERGFTLGWSSTGGELNYAIRHGTLESMTQNVLTVVLPDDDETLDAHPWEWLATLAQARGLQVTALDLKDLPYEVVFTESALGVISPL